MRKLQIIVTGLIICNLSYGQDPSEISSRIPGQLIVHHRGDPGNPALTGLFASHRAHVKRSLPQLNASVIQVAPGSEDAVAQSLRGNRLVAEVEYDHYARPAATPNDPDYGSQWHLSKIQAPSGWNITTGSAALPIAVVDSGVDSTHPDLAPRIVPGWNFVTNSSNTADDYGHGTAVAGTLGAVTNNSLGVAGVTWQNPIMPLVVLDSSGYASYSNLAAAIQYAADRGARIVNVSLGGTASSSVLQNAVNYAWNKGTVVVAAAMNNASNVPNYPAACSNVIAVSATDQNDNLAGFSDYGSWIALSAPGTDIWTTVQGGGYQPWEGTSFAAPIVSGVAALVLAVNPSLSPQALVALLEHNSDQVGGAGYNQSFGWGRVNAFRAVIAAGGAAPPPVLNTPPPASPAPSSPGTPGSATFLQTDSATLGSWKSRYGADGYNVIGDTANYPSYVTVSVSGNSSYVWSGSTGDIRALQKASSATDRISACWYASNSFSIHLAFSDSNVHQVALYLADYDLYGGGRSEQIQILGGNGNVLYSQAVSGFGNGQYLVWNLGGNVTLQITNTNPYANAVVSGLFFGQMRTGTPTASASFLQTDTSTLGSWKGRYGADGYNIIGDTANYPPYVAVNVSGNSSYVWSGSTGDIRALQKASSATDRIAACWYVDNSFSIHLAFSDSNIHQVALYLLDYSLYGGGRREQIQILDANGNVLNSQPASGFGNGQYLVWNLSGNVTIQVTNTNPWANAVVSGLFFR